MTTPLKEIPPCLICGEPGCPGSCIDVDLQSMEVTEADVRALLIDGELETLRAERDQLWKDLDKVTQLPPWWALSEKR